MAKYEVTKIFIGIFLLTFVSKGVLATMSCFVCLPSYSGNDNSVKQKANAVTNEVKNAKSNADSCNLFVAGGMDSLNQVNPNLKVDNCNRCVKVYYEKGGNKFVGRGCEKSGSDFTAILAATAADSNYNIYYCDNEKYCNAAPSHFTGSFFSMVISLVVLSLKKFM
ncbi:UNVERIFIED_CONTAM: hypothetical protein RMT77_018165 [Armadillidium vulgare]